VSEGARGSNIDHKGDREGWRGDEVKDACIKTL